MVIMSIFVIIFNDMVYPVGSPERLTIAECLLLSSVLWATDTVAALAIVKESDYPTLNSILFGEGVVNDAVAILIFKAVEKMIEAGHSSSSSDWSGLAGYSSSSSCFTSESVIDTKGVTIGGKEIGNAVLDFFVLTFSSLGVGIAVGLLSAFISKRVPSLHHHPVLEIFLIILFGYISYLLAELLSLSGIMTLFFWGVIMSHYSYHNVSEESKVGSIIAISTFGFAAEAFLFTYLGLSIFSTESSSFSLSFTFYIIIAAVFSRFGSIFISIAIYALFKRWAIDVSWKQLTLIFFSGLIRGAIAFALSLEINEDIAPHRNEMVSTTLMMVLMTTIVLGGVMSAFAKLIGLDKENVGSEHGGDHDSYIDQLDYALIRKPKKKSWLQKKLNWLDDSVLKPLFGGDLSRIKAHKEENKFEEEMQKMYQDQKDIKQKPNVNAAINISGSKGSLGDLKSGKIGDADSKQKTEELMQNLKLTSIAEDEEDN